MVKTKINKIMIVLQITMLILPTIISFANSIENDENIEEKDNSIIQFYNEEIQTWEDVEAKTIYYQINEKEIIAYKVDKNNTSEKVYKILENGYPKLNAEKLNLEVNEDAYLATQMALKCIEKDINEEAVYKYFRTTPNDEIEEKSIIEEEISQNIIEESEEEKIEDQEHKEIDEENIVDNEYKEIAEENIVDIEIKEETNLIDEEVEEYKEIAKENITDSEIKEEINLIDEEIKENKEEASELEEKIEDNKKEASNLETVTEKDENELEKEEVDNEINNKEFEQEEKNRGERVINAIYKLVQIANNQENKDNYVTNEVVKYITIDKETIAFLDVNVVEEEILEKDRNQDNESQKLENQESENQELEKNKSEEEKEIKDNEENNIDEEKNYKDEYEEENNNQEQTDENYEETEEVEEIKKMPDVLLQTENKNNIKSNEEIENKIKIKNSGNTSLTNFSIYEIFENNVAAPSKISTGIYNSSVNYSIYYKTNKKVGYVLLKSNLDSKINYDIDLSNIELENEEYITEIKIEYDSVEEGFENIEELKIYMQINNQVNEGEKVNSYVIVEGYYNDYKICDEAEIIQTVYKNEAKKKLPKTGY